MAKDRIRMIFDVTREIQMAIRLRAIKSGQTTGQVLEDAIRQQHPSDVADAVAIHSRPKPKDQHGRRTR